MMKRAYHQMQWQSSGRPEVDKPKKRTADIDKGFDSGDHKTIHADMEQILTDKNYNGDGS